MPTTLDKNDLNISTYVEKSRELGRTVVGIASDTASTVLDIPEGFVREYSPEPVKAIAEVPASVARRVVDDVTKTQLRLLG